MLMRMTNSDSCALSLQPFRNPVAVIADSDTDETPRADVFDLLNIVPYVRKFKTSQSDLFSSRFAGSHADTNL